MFERIASSAGGWRAARRTTGLLALTSMLAVVVAGCGDDSGDGSAAASAPAESATVVTMDVPGYGMVLGTSDGRPLHLRTTDPAGSTVCSEACQEEWEPLVAEGAPTAGPDVDGGLLKTFANDDGAQQVMYKEQALYTHKGQGLATGVGKETDGGLWYFLDAEGNTVFATVTGGY